MSRRDEIVLPGALIAKVSVAVVVVVFALVVAFGDKPLEVGADAPAASGVAVDGSAFDLDDHRGRYVFVNVWATWCGPCVAELPALIAASQKHADVVFVGLAGGDSPRAAIDAAVARHGIPYPVVPVDDALERRWRVEGFPSSFLVDPRGNLAWIGDGGLSDAALEHVLAQTAQK